MWPAHLPGPWPPLGPSEGTLWWQRLGMSRGSVASGILCGRGHIFQSIRCPRHYGQPELTQRSGSGASLVAGLCWAAFRPLGSVGLGTCDPRLGWQTQRAGASQLGVLVTWRPAGTALSWVQPLAARQEGQPGSAPNSNL